MSAPDDERVATLIAELKQLVAKSEDTIELVEEYSVAERGRAMINLFNKGEYEYMPAFLPSDHIHDMRPVHVPGMGVYRGLEEYARFIADWTESFPGAQLETEFELEISEPVDALFTIVKQEMSGGASDVPIAFRYAMLAEYSEERHESMFGTDVEEMRSLFRKRYGKDPGPFELQPVAAEAKQEA